MKKNIIFLSLLVAANAYGYTRWCQPDEEKPKQAFDCFIGGDDETCYVQLTPEAKQALKTMLSNARKDEKIGDVIDRVEAKVKSPAGKEALKALKEMEENDPELPAGVIKDGMFGDGKNIKKVQTNNALR